MGQLAKGVRQPWHCLILSINHLLPQLVRSLLARTRGSRLWMVSIFPQTQTDGPGSSFPGKRPLCSFHTELVCSYICRRLLMSRLWFWTLLRAFFTYLGGIILERSEYLAFPVSASDLHYLVRKKYLESPTLLDKTITKWTKTMVSLLSLQSANSDGFY